MRPVLESITLSPNHRGAPAGSLCAQLLAEGFTVKLDLLEEDQPPEDSLDTESLGYRATPDGPTVRERIASGDPWAWFLAEVTVSHPDTPGVVGRDFLGACSYRGPEDFMDPDPGSYWPDMVFVAFQGYQQEAQGRLESAQKALPLIQRATPTVAVVRCTYDVTTEESAQDGDVSERGWVGSDRYTQHPIPEGQVGEAATAPGSEWSKGRAASAVEFRLGEDGSSLKAVAEAVAEHVVESIWALDNDNGNGSTVPGRSEWERRDFYGAAGSPSPSDGSVESRCAHVEATPTFLEMVAAAVRRNKGA